MTSEEIDRELKRITRVALRAVNDDVTSGEGFGILLIAFKVMNKGVEDTEDVTTWINFRSECPSEDVIAIVRGAMTEWEKKLETKGDEEE